MAEPATDQATIAAIMEAIGPIMPLDDGGHWAPTFQPAWPKDYTKAEVFRARGVASVALEVVKRLGWTPENEEIERRKNR